MKEKSPIRKAKGQFSFRYQDGESAAKVGEREREREKKRFAKSAFAGSLTFRVDHVAKGGVNVRSHIAAQGQLE
jgi:hypothetical protein